MSNKQPILDTIIVGQGLAGSLLAWQLILHRQKVMVIDNGAFSASRMCAGLVNPVTGKRLVKTAKIEEYLPVANSLYSGLGDFFNKQFFHPMDMLRLFRSDQEHELWDKRIADPEYKDYLGDCIVKNSNPYVQDPYGSFTQKQTGYLDTVALLDSLRDFFTEKESYLKTKLDYSDIHVGSDHIELHNMKAKRLIFCEGHQAVDNPWFSWLPFKLAKGEILTLTTEQPLPKEIINAGKWLLPISDGIFKIGSTYQWEQLTEEPTDNGKEELLAAMSTILKHPSDASIVSHKAGIRPCTKDTKPYIGLHPEDQKLGIFNGFGSKGALVIPLHSFLFTKHLYGEHTIKPVLDIKRYWKKVG